MLPPLLILRGNSLLRVECTSTFQTSGVIWMSQDPAAGVGRLQSLSPLVDKLFTGRQALLCWQDRLIGKFFTVGKTFVLNEISREISGVTTS